MSEAQLPGRQLGAILVRGPQVEQRRGLDHALAAVVTAAQAEERRAQQLAEREAQLRRQRMSARDVVAQAPTVEEIEKVLGQARERKLPAPTMRKLEAAAAARRDVLEREAIRRSLLP